MPRDVVDEAEWTARLKTLARGTPLWEVEAETVTPRWFDVYEEGAASVFATKPPADPSKPPPALLRVSPDRLYDDEDDADAEADAIKGGG